MYAENIPVYPGKLAIVVKDFGRGFDPCFV